MRDMSHKPVEAYVKRKFDSLLQAMRSTGYASPYKERYSAVIG